jgi:DNA-directed RNA polymerase subunit K/omega
VSRRVKQLNSGQRPLVKPDFPLMERLDIALKEIADGKLTAELCVQDATATPAAAAFKSLFND